MRTLTGVVGGMLLVLAGCASSQEVSAPTSTTTGTSTTTATSTTTTAPPPSSTGLPAAADGTDVTACGDGTCEIEASAPRPIPLPPAAGATLVLISVVDESVTLAFTPTGQDFSSGCEPIAACTNELNAGVPGSVVRADIGATVTFNKAAVVVADAAGTTALLRISLV